MWLDQWRHPGNDNTKRSGRASGGQKRRYGAPLHLLFIVMLLLPQAALAQNVSPSATHTPEQSQDVLEADALIEAHVPPAATLVRTIDTSAFNTPSSDPSGVIYLPATDQLLISDSEIEEIPALFQGANLYYVAMNGTLVLTATTTNFSSEPTGLALNPGNGHIFISDDGSDRVYEMEGPGLDGVYGTGDEVITSFRTNISLGSLDTEGLDFAVIDGIPTLFIIDGLKNIVYVLKPGENGIFNGGGDDIITSFESELTGITSIGGVAYHPTRGTLFLAGVPKTRIAEVTTTGNLVRLIDTSPAGAERPDGLGFGPGVEPSLYMTDRGIDNFNDGKVYELGLPAVTTGNQPPLTDAGPNQVVNLPAQSTTLAGVVTDDGIPGGLLTHKWTVVNSRSVTRTVTFNNNDLLNATASFPQSGVYVLRLTADDNELASVDAVTITVNAPPVVDAGIAQSVNLAAGANLAGVVTDDGLPLPATITATWSMISGPGVVTFTTPSALNTAATFSAAGVYVLNLSANDGGAVVNDTVTITVNQTNQAPIVEAGPAQVIALATTVTLSGTVTDDGLPTTSITSTWSLIDGPATGTVNFGDPSAATTTADFSLSGIYHLQLSATDGILTTSDTTTVTVASASNIPPTVNAGADQLVALTGPANLDGTVADDGMPSGQLTTTWSKVSGPGTVTFGSASAVDTTATFSAPGVYVLALTANDGDVSVDDTVVITVNAAPTVTAGTAQTIDINQSATLDGTVTDDGRPTPPTLATTWAKVSGPGTVTFANASAIDTTATFSQAGVYVLSLTANDGHSTGSATVTITVRQPNQPPTVSAGVNLTVTVSTIVNLDGTAQDDGLPTPPGAITSTWSKVSGPGTVTFGNLNATDTTATFSAVGVYVLRLTVDDGELDISDTIQVVVQPAGERKLFLPIVTKAP